MLETVDEVILSLGGPTKTGKLVGMSPQAVVQWRARQRIPAIYRDVILSHLRENNLDAPSSLWGMVERAS